MLVHLLYPRGTCLTQLPRMLLTSLTKYSVANCGCRAKARSCKRRHHLWASETMAVRTASLNIKTATYSSTSGVPRQGKKTVGPAANGWKETWHIRETQRPEDGCEHRPLWSKCQRKTPFRSWQNLKTTVVNWLRRITVNYSPDFGPTTRCSKWNQTLGGKRIRHTLLW